MSGSAPVAASGSGSERRPSFTSGGEVFREIQRDVEAVLARKGIRTRALIQPHLKTVIAVLLPIIGWIVLMTTSPGVLLGIACLLVVGLGAMLVAFCVQHDANHGASFRSRRINRIVGFSADAMLGFSSYAWRIKHNVAHHTYTNVDNYDDDISQVPFARLLPVQSSKPWYRLQHFYIWPMYSLMVLRMQAFGDIAALVRGRIGRSRVRMPRGWDLAGIVSGKLVYIGWAIVIPLLIYPWWVVVIAYVGVAMVVGLVTATTFQLAHCVDEAVYRSDDELGDGETVWAVHQIESTVDFCPRNPVLTWVLGGLNYQIEHHLFPRLPHTLYPQIAGIVRSRAERHGVRYTCQPSLWRALCSHASHVREMGRRGEPAEIEMG
ncbi:MAG: linoleoyl-CoA desaturase [Gaiellales bacterium]|nr:linoleoyl-CoA desaturase [Gaiellales bacterium]